jgi:predicted DCC family thiol-disulfide oxidoreductase YuxK
MTIPMLPRLIDTSMPTHRIRAYFIQFLIFSYVVYRYLSRSYESYGFLPESSFSYPRWWIADLWKWPVLHFSTFQFVYNWIPHPSADQIRIIQYLIVLAALAGLAGIGVKYAAGICFVLASHLEGIAISADAEISGATVMLASLLLILFTPKRAFYALGINYNNSYSIESTFLVFNFSLLLAIFYFLPGLNKIVDCGLNWPFTVRLYLAASNVLQSSFLYNQRFSFVPLVQTQQYYMVSVLGGLTTLFAELAALVFVTTCRYKFLIVSLLIGMHTFVYLMVGINFTGNSILLLGVLDISIFAENAFVVFDDRCNFCVACKNMLNSLRPLGVKFIGISQIGKTLTEGDKKRIDISRCRKAICFIRPSDICYGSSSISSLLLKSILFPLGLLMHLIPFNFISALAYHLVSRNRYRIMGKCDSDNCEL